MDVYLEVQRRALEELGAPGLVYGDFRAVNADDPKRGGLPTDYVLQEGDLFILDYSVLLGGYRSDTTNTIAVSGPNAEQQRLFEDCVNSLKAGEEKLLPGMPAKDIFAAAEQRFLDEGYEPSPPRHMGHGLGLGHPEPPIIVPESSDVLAAGDVVTLEPARYIKGIGGVRVEHNYLITEEGFKRLSHQELAL
jgi:Xaa-Pro aminopeptidase